MKKVKTLAVVLVFSLCLGGVMAGCGDADPGPGPEENSVTSIRLRYNNAQIPNNSLTVNLTLGTLTFTADVQVSGNASKDFTLESSKPDVATISDKTVTLHAAGQTKITAIAAGDSSKKHTITLNVIDNTPYSITVTGGTADKTTAVAGQTVTLTPGTPPQGKVFSDWTIEPDVFMLPPNSFVMPPSNVIVTGNFEDASTATIPYNITNNFGQDSSAEFLAQWHNDSTVTTQTLQFVTASGSFADATEITATGVAFQGSASQTPPNNIGDYSLRNVFRAHVEDLSPDTRYKYRVGADGAWSPVFYHLTSKGTFADFSFTVATDPQNGEHSAMITTLNAANDFDDNNRFFLMLGDIVNDTGKNPGEIVSYTNAANEFNNSRPISATQGNHDTYLNVSASDQYVFGEATVFNAFVTFPDNGWDTNQNKANRSQAYYYYYNKVLIIMLNTMATANATGISEPNHTQQAAWLRQILQNDREQGLSRYTIVGTHVSPFGGRAAERWLQANVRAAYGPICSEFGVDLFFAGHDHVYGRSNPIKMQTGQTALDDIDFNETPGGTIYSIVSATGPKFYAIEQADTWVPQYFPVRTDTIAAQSPDGNVGVYVNVKVTEEKLTVTAMRAKDGVELDTYEVPAK